MTAEGEVGELLAEAGRAMGRHFEIDDPDGITLISQPKDDVADSVDVFVVQARPRRDDAVLILSAPNHSENVDRAVAGAKQIVGMLPPHLAKTVLLPDYQGQHGNRSFAIYPRLRPLSRNRLVNLAQKRLIRNEVRDWTIELAFSTRRTVEDPAKLEERFLAPLTHLAEEEGLSDALRRAAAKAAEKLQDPGAAAPVLVVQHGDLWLDNVLLNPGWPGRRGNRFGFSIIDWGTVNAEGYPFIDFLRYGLSSTRNMTWIARGIDAQRARLGLSTEAVVPHVCAGIGWLGMHRNHFPLPRYVSLAETLFASARHLAA